MNDQMFIDIEKKKDKDVGITVKSDGEYRKLVRNRSAALRALKSAKNKGALRDVRRNYLYKKNGYPNSLTEAQELLNHYSVTSRTTENRGNGKKEKNIDVRKEKANDE